MHHVREQPADVPNRSITIPQSELLPRGDHASLTICGFIQLAAWSMIHIMQRGKRESSR
ncbi:hypothetical protein [Bradyrhizobium sp. Cp5.3]|uniref:hypothetical protein n=1 Tax=Bradyrhizobium sp. Cp5.3 TaxID=443598 RepID=UPI0004193429|nr:hypothetical protein [Bradyrhizobium sp. Cp5.3]